jgi:retinol dehydrogenase-12
MASPPGTPRDLAGRTFIVTGATGGIGHVTAGVLAQRGARVLLGCRTSERGEAAAARLRAAAGSTALDIEPFPVDLGDLASVRAAPAAFLAGGRPLHALINNAGVAGTRGLTRDGFELTFGVNHLGPFLLTRLLEARLREGAPARVVNVSSQAHRSARGVDFSVLQQPALSRSGIHEYAVSKLCNVLFTRELARRWAGSGVTSYALHPGVVATDIWRRLPPPLRWLVTRFMVSPADGARTTIYCATDPTLAGVSGRYYDRQREATPSLNAQDDALAVRLWEESEKMAGLPPG